MTFLFSNNAQTTLAESLTSTATNLTVASGKGTLFPTPADGNLFAVTLTSANNPDEVEICHCSAVNSDTLTILRGQDGTTAQTFSAGDLVSLFPTAGVTSLFAQAGYLGVYSSTVASMIGGYPLNAIVASSTDAGTFWVSTVNSNMTVPGASGASWQSLFDGYATETWVNGTFVSGTTGYEIKPNGKIEQWGEYTTTSTGLLTVSFPTSFPNSCDNIQLTEADASGQWTNNTPTLHGVYSAPNTAAFIAVVRTWSAVNSSWGPGSASGYWRATGH